MTGDGWENVAVTERRERAVINWHLVYSMIKFLLKIGARPDTEMENYEVRISCYTKKGSRVIINGIEAKTVDATTCCDFSTKNDAAETVATQHSDTTITNYESEGHVKSMPEQAKVWAEAASRITEPNREALEAYEPVVLRVIEENGQDYAVIHVDELAAMQATASAEAKMLRVIEKLGHTISNIMSYAQHDEDCHINNWGDNQIPECTCGYTSASQDALEKLESFAAPLLSALAEKGEA